jgi:uncharacterized membrane protein HdeD (DUF308 family)
MIDTLSIEYNNEANRIQYWWGLLVSGLMLFLAGCVLFQYPLGNYLGINAAFGIVMILFGISHMSFNSANRTVLPHWQWQVVMSITDIILGMVLLMYADISVRYMPLLLGGWFFIRGLSLLIYALSLRQLVFNGWGWILTTGILTLFLALFVVYNPVFGLFTVLTWTSFAFMLTGIFIILLSLKIKMGRDELESIIL